MIAFHLLSQMPSLEQVIHQLQHRHSALVFSLSSLKHNTAIAMGLGILQPKDGHHVPGTVNLDEAAGTATVNNSHLKHGTGKNSHIVLVPQPSDDPNDPLNWSTMKKSIVMTIILMGTTFVCIVPVRLLSGLSSFATTGRVAANNDIS
jgi:hypothetical protein